MDPNTDQENLQMPCGTENDGRVNRPIKLPAWADSRWMAVISIFCIGLLSGFGGGFLLGGTSIVLLQSVELLADNRQFMDQFENFIAIFMVKYILGRDPEETSQWIGEIYVNISCFTTVLGVVSSIFSVALGLCIGLSTYSLGIKKGGEAAEGKALGVTGPVCLMVVTATGCLLGLGFESFLSVFITLDVRILVWFFFILLAASLFLILIFSCLNEFTLCISIPVGQFITFFKSFLFKMRLILVALFTPVIQIIKSIEEPYVTPHSLLFIFGAFNIAGHHIVVFQSPTLTYESRIVLLAIFAGVFISQLWAVSMGSSLFVSWQRGGAGKICATAAVSGTAVLGVIKLVLPSLGPGPSIGALMGVAGAVGVSLSAAGAATDQYGREVDHCGLSGQLGVAVGAAVGAFLSSHTYSGVSGMFMGLCAAIVSAADFLKMHLYSTSWGKFLYICMFIFSSFALIL